MGIINVLTKARRKSFAFLMIYPVRRNMAGCDRLYLA